MAEHSPGQVEAVVDDLRPIDDRDGLEGVTERVTSGWRCGQALQSGAPSWGWASGRGWVGRQVPTNGFICS